MPIDLRFVGGIGPAEDHEDPAERFDEIVYFLACEAETGRRLSFGVSKCGLGGGAFGLCLADPGGHDRWIRAGFECHAVPGEFPVAGSDLLLDRIDDGSSGVRLARLECVQGGCKAVRVEGCGEPGVEIRQDGVLAQVDRERVINDIRDGVFLRVAAAVVGVAVVPGALPAPALLVDQQAA
ncbi:hypothetical protein ACG83_20955 [Frankia sp. R43]|uniref:hypothetical protein n=1 Tax=Frankia sp. R43 TaxID=269536 RepID=UPI0006CA0A66|nr:hypothetical protein [Frankia sp. R43]KPM54390.1 hypothetical protein ACG83_20955 [Frankia sp. R43]